MTTARCITCALGIALVVSLWRYVDRGILEPCRAGGKDFGAYYCASRLLRQRGDVYDTRALRTEGQRSGAEVDRDGYGYPPLLAVLVTPLTLTDFHVARCAWVVISQLLLAGVLALLCSTLLPRGSGRTLGAAVLLLVALNSEPLMAHLRAGQSNLLVLGLVCASLWAFHRGRPMAAGAALGTAAAVKIFPVTLIAYFLWKRHYRLVAAACLAILAWTALSVAFAGVETHVHFATCVLPEIASHPSDVFHPSNQSIYACFSRLFIDNLYTDPVLNSPIRARLTSWICCAVLVAITVLLCRPRSPAIDVEVGLVVVATTLIVTLAWDANFVAMLLPTAVALRELMAADDARRPRMAAALVVSLALIHARFGVWAGADGQARSLMLLCPRLVGSLVLYVLLARTLSTRAQADEPRGSGGHRT